MNNKSINYFDKLADFRGLKISLAGPEEIRGWSFGEVTKAETINYRTLKPEKDGLFCEKIFGPTKDWECYCGKYKRIRYKGIICDKCGVEVTQSKVRRERMGHITLAVPVAHVWYFRGAPSKMSTVLDVPVKALENVIYFAQYLVLKIDEEKRKEVLKKLTEAEQNRSEELRKTMEEQIQKIEAEAQKDTKEAVKSIKSVERRDLATKEIELKAKEKIQGLRDNLAMEISRAEQLFKNLRGRVEEIGARSIISEDEYFKLEEYGATKFLEIGTGAEAVYKLLKEVDVEKLTNELRKEVAETSGARHLKAAKRLRLIEGMRKAAVRPEWMILTILPVIPPDLRPMVQLQGGRFATSDLNDLYRRVINRNNRLKHLIDLGAPEIILRNEKRMLQEAVDALMESPQKSGGRMAPAPLKSLSEILRGKHGRFRQNLLGKRVDYSGRSVIVVGPELKINQCGLPKEMALEMFKPFVLRELIIRGFTPNIKTAKRHLERRPPEVFDILEDITRNHPVLLNRAPTLHKLGIQAFYPILIEGLAIHLHPCVCSGYNADFDGDQMAVHIPLSRAAQKEAMELMSPEKNLLKPSDGSPISAPSAKGMALGVYYLTSLGDEPPCLTIFADRKEAILAYQSKKIGLRQLIKLREERRIIETTVGRLLFNEVLPSQLGFVNEIVKKGTINELFDRALRLCSQEEVVKMIDDVKNIGFWAETLAGGISVGIFDMLLHKEKEETIKEGNKQVVEQEGYYGQGLITREEMHEKTNEIWAELIVKLMEDTWNILPTNNAVRMLLDSGAAKGSKDTLKQICAMRGFMNDVNQKIIPVPVKSNFREGATVFEYIIGTRGSRKGLADLALRTADAGYLTRRLVDVSHDMIIREADCGTKEGIEMTIDKAVGRVLAKKIMYGKTKKTLLKDGELIIREHLEVLHKAKIETVICYSPLTCQSKFGICQKCYGFDLSTQKMVAIGVPVGIIAAQSIGEPGTQLSMRTKQTGGIVGAVDLNVGLPRVEEMFEARIPKMPSPLAEISGKVSVDEMVDGYKLTIKPVGIKGEEKTYVLPLGVELKAKEGDFVGVGDSLCEGKLDIHEILEVKGLLAAQRYLISEIQTVYNSQGVPIDDKHFEVIVRKMSDKVMIVSGGDTRFLSGEIVEKTVFEEENAQILAAGAEPATATVKVLGVSQAALHTSSWLSAASFEQTVSVLTKAALSGAVDKLVGLKENVIIGRLIPVEGERVKIEE